jgi:hypothetical protein
MASAMSSLMVMAHGVVQPTVCEPGQEVMGTATGVRADQHPAMQPPGQLGQRQPGHLDVLGCGVDPGVPGPQHDGQCSPARSSDVVSERGQRVEPERLLPRRRSLLFL